VLDILYISSPSLYHSRNISVSTNCKTSDAILAIFLLFALPQVWNFSSTIHSTMFK